MTVRYARAAYPLSSKYLTGYRTASYPAAGGAPGANWPGASSAGPSGDAARAAHAEGATGVTAGASLNGFASARLVSSAPTSGYLHNGVLGVARMSDYFTPTTFGFVFVIDANYLLIYAGAGGVGAIARDATNAYFGLSYVAVGAHSGGAPVVHLHAFNAGGIVIAERNYTIDSGHVPHVVTGRLANGRLEVGVNEVPGAQGGFSSVAYTGAIPAIGMADTLNIGTSGGTGMNADLWDHALTNQVWTDNDFEDALLHLRVKFNRAFAAP